MANRKGITSLDLLFKKSAQEITWEKKSSLLNLKIVTYILSFAVVEGAEDDQDADHHKYEGWKTPPIILRWEFSGRHQSKTEASSLRRWGSSSLALSSGSHCSSWSWEVEIFDLEKTFVSTYMLMRLVICTLYWALMPATVVGKNMVAQARVTNNPLKNRATELQPWCDD